MSIKQTKTKHAKLVSIIILNWNGKKWLETCLNSVHTQTYKNIEIILADNNSTDDSISYVQDNYPFVKIVKLEENYGFALGNNKAVPYATGDIFLFLNNDTKLFPDFIENLVKAYEPKSIIVPMQLVGDFSKIQKEDEFKVLFGNGVDIFGYPYGVNDYKDQKVFYADGASLFISKEDFINLGLFDAKLFMFQEDIDLSWRARLRGFKIKLCPGAKMFHYSGGSAIGGLSDSKRGKYTMTSFRRYHNEKNIIRNILKNYSTITAVSLLLILLILHIIEFFALLLILKRDLAFAYIRAYVWNFRNFKDTISWRKKVQARRIINDMVILKSMYLRYSKFTAILRVGIPDIK